MKRLTLEAAIRADLNARRYVLIEKIKKAPTADECCRLFTLLDAIEHRLECRELRTMLKSGLSYDGQEYLLRARIMRMEKESQYQKA